MSELMRDGCVAVCEVQVYLRGAVSVESQCDQFGVESVDDSTVVTLALDSFREHVQFSWPLELRSERQVRILGTDALGSWGGDGYLELLNGMEVVANAARERSPAYAPNDDNLRRDAIRPFDFLQCPAVVVQKGALAYAVPPTRYFSGVPEEKVVGRISKEDTSLAPVNALFRRVDLT